MKYQSRGETGQDGRRRSRRSRRGRVSCRGTAIVEAAITLVGTLFFLFGLMEIGRFLSTQETVTNAAREGARLAVTPLPQSTSLPAAAEIEARVDEFLTSNNLTGATVTVAPLVTTYGTVNTELTQVRVEVPYSLVTGLAWFEALEVTLVGEAVMRDETSP